MSLLLNVGLVCNVYRRVGVAENAKAKMQSACLHRNILFYPEHDFMKHKHPNWGRSMVHGPSSIHGPGRGCHDVEAKREDFFNVFG